MPSTMTKTATSTSQSTRTPLMHRFSHNLLFVLDGCVWAVSPNRQRMFDQTGRFQAPYLTDANTDTEGGVALWESAAIIEYLQKVYGIADSPIKYL